MIAKPSMMSINQCEELGLGFTPQYQRRESLSNSDGHDEMQLPNIPDCTFDFSGNRKAATANDKFIFDLLSLSEVQSPCSPERPDTDEDEHIVDGESLDLSIKSIVPKQWIFPKSDELQIMKDFMPVETRELEKLTDPRIAVSGEDGTAKPDNVVSKCDSLSISVQTAYESPSFSEIRRAPTLKDTRTRRRREFHKIHTRRSRAKLNEKMDMLRRVLPEPPAGLVVKSKAQIIDYAINVLAKLPLNHLETGAVYGDK